MPDPIPQLPRTPVIRFKRIDWKEWGIAVGIMLLGAFTNIYSINVRNWSETSSTHSTFPVEFLIFAFVVLVLSFVAFVKLQGVPQSFAFVTMFMLVSQIPDAACGRFHPIMRTQSRAKWGLHVAEYKRIANELKTSTKSPAWKVLCIDGYVDLEATESGNIITFMQFKWGVDDSYSIVYVPGNKPLPKSTRDLKEWRKTEPLEPNWYLVEGT